jgi:hypothetical protein
MWLGYGVETTLSRMSGPTRSGRIAHPAGAYSKIISLIVRIQNLSSMQLEGGGTSDVQR